MTQNKLQHRASLHEKAVQRVASNEIDAIKTPRKRGQNKNSRLTIIKVKPEVMEVAKKLLEDSEEHGYTRMEIVSEEEVILR